MMRKEIKITVFTPTYNRAYRLSALYNSLKTQTYECFEWLILDDGSSDDTKTLVDSFIAESKVRINYQFQENRGKHIAINNGVSIANGNLFFIVDSDDILPPDSLALIMRYYERIENNKEVGGVVGRKAYYDGTTVGSRVDFDPIITTAIDIRYKRKIVGDLAEIFKTSVLKEYPFPNHSGEGFCPEALIWNRISAKYKLLYFNEPVYLCEYLSDGLTASIVKIRMRSPIATMETYSELSKLKIPTLQKIKALLNYWRFSFNSPISITQKLKNITNNYSIMLIPMGYLMHLKDRKKL